MIGVVDIGIGNYRSVEKVLQKFGKRYCKVSGPGDFLNLSKLIFPGVGSYPAAMDRLSRHRMIDPIKKHIDNGRPYLGICLGMQLLSRVGFEGGTTPGLGVVDAEVVKLVPLSHQALPHIGWNQINHDGKGIFDGIALDADFYFVHSYCMSLHEPVKHFSVEYGGMHTCFIEKGNVVGAQFHPEKSQKVGLKFIENFLNA